MKKTRYLFTAAATLTLAACATNLTSGENTNSGTDKGTDTASSSSSQSTETVDLVTADTLEIAYSLNNSQTLTYNQSTPLTMPDGTTVVQGDLKPIWQHISDELGFQIKDTALQDATAKEFIELEASTGFENATIYSGEANVQYMRYGQEGYFVDLSQRMNDMPNVKKFFEENPTLLETVTAPDGGIYHLPYVPELGYHSMVFFGRPDWVTSLLDSEDYLETEAETISVVYDGVWDNRHDKNVVELQNEAAANGVLDRDAALQVLKDYIKDTYPDLTKPSDLYLGEKAQYDMDELVALWRVIKSSPNTLSKVTTGEVVDGALTTPFFVRSIQHTNYLLRLLSYFGGQIGGDTQTTFYINHDGELSFSWNEPGALAAYTNLRELFAEGLIYNEIANENNDENFRNLLYGADENPENVQYGFMTFDWIASTSAASGKVAAMMPPLTTPIEEGEFVHYLGGYRPLLNFGSAVSAASTDEEINAALTLFDWIYSEEGHTTLNFGTSDMWVEGETFVGPDGTEYPKIGEWAFEQAAQYANNDLMSFMKNFLGANLQTAYEKSIGVELQFTNEIGLDAWDMYQNNPVLRPSYEAEENILSVPPATWPVDEQKQARLDQTNIGLDQEEQIKLYIYGASAGPQSEEDIVELYEQGNVDTYIQVYREMYDSITQ